MEIDIFSRDLAIFRVFVMGVYGRKWFRGLSCETRLESDISLLIIDSPYLKLGVISLSVHYKFKKAYLILMALRD